jgi:hypothetical protein
MVETDWGLLIAQVVDFGLWGFLEEERLKS